MAGPRGSKGITVLTLLVVLAGACGTRLPAATVQPSPPADVAALTAGQPLTYRGITPGVSRKGDVLAQWGEPNVIRAYATYESLHYFRPDPRHPEEYVLLEDDTVLAVTWTDRDQWLTKDGHPASFDDLVEVLGTPHVLAPTLVYESPSPIAVFPEYGLAAEFSAGEIYVYQSFSPMSIQDYQAVWGPYDLGLDPFPPIPSVEEVGIAPGQTAREEVGDLLGPPDRIVFEDANDPWLYYIEPDTLGFLRIHFHLDDVVSGMFIEPGTHISFEEVVREYGLPDVVQLVPDLAFGGKEGFYRQILVYLNRGLGVVTTCYAEGCESVRRDAVMAMKVYFEPMTLDEYRADRPPESIYFEWSGFDE